MKLHDIYQSRYRYYRSAGRAVGELIETLCRLAPPEPVRSLRQGTRAHQLRRARTCFDHLAGRLGVAVTERLVDCGALEARPDHDSGSLEARPSDDGTPLVGHGSVNGASDQPGYTLRPAGNRLMSDLGARLEPGCWVRVCVDWTEQRQHMAGPHGRALLGRFFELAWLRGAERGRAVDLTPAGRAGLSDWIGLDLAVLD